MEVRRTAELVTADTVLPLRRGWKAESRGSSLFLTATTYIEIPRRLDLALTPNTITSWIFNLTSGTLLDETASVLFALKALSDLEKTESVCSAGWTERTTSLVRYATLATENRRHTTSAHRHTCTPPNTPAIGDKSYLLH